MANCLPEPRVYRAKESIAMHFTTLLVVGLTGGLGGSPLALPRGAGSDDKDISTAVEHSKPIVDSLYRFKHDRGLWPNDLKELVPAYLRARQIRGWHYQSWYTGRWSLTSYAGYPRYAIRVIHSPGTQVKWWRIDEEDMPLTIKYKIPRFAYVEKAWVEKRRQETILSRIRENPKQIIHRKALIGMYYAKGQYNNAKAGCLACLHHWPDIWWPNLMLALTDTRLGKADEAEKKLVTWVRKHHDFHHWYLMAYYYHVAGQKEKCITALKKASRSPLRSLSEEWEVDTGEKLSILPSWAVARYAALLAYQERRLDVCLAICEKWKCSAKYSGEPYFYIMQAVCYLNQAKLTEAKAAIKAASQCAAHVNYGRGFERDIAKVREAIERRHINYKHDPKETKDTCPPFLSKLLIEYE